MFDGSPIARWKSIDQSDMMLMPGSDTALVDPFFTHPTVSFRCDVLEPGTHKANKRDPRSLGNPYLTFASILMAGLDGIERELSPGAPADVDLYDFSVKKGKTIDSVCSSLPEALAALNSVREFLKKAMYFQMT